MGEPFELLSRPMGSCVLALALLGASAASARADDADPAPAPAPQEQLPPDEQPPPEQQQAPPPQSLPTPRQTAAAAVAHDADKDPRARPYFIKGELSGGDAVRPLGKRSFIGAGAGIAALPSSAGTALNSFFFTIEPQVDLRFPEHHDLKVGLGVPLNFELADTRAAFEACVPVARSARMQAAGQPADQQQQFVDAKTAECVSMQQDRATENLGQLRKRDWDEVSDFAKIIRYVTVGGEEQEFYLNVSRLYGQSVGHGTVVRRYNPNLDFDTTRVGITFDGFYQFVGVESMINDVLKPDVFGLLAFVRPLEPLFPDVTALRSLSFGVQATVGRHVPRTLGYEEGLWAPSAGVPIPALDADANLAVVDDDTVIFLGFDAETKLWRTRQADLKVYFDAQSMQDHGSGFTLGSLWRFSFGEPAYMALRVRAEAFVHDADYLPSFFDGFYDVHKLQYIPAGYTSGMGTYYPTKLGFVEAMKGGPRRLGGYLEVTHSFVGLLTLGLSARNSGAIGDPAEAGFDGPRFQDASTCPIGTTGALGCPATVKVDPGYASALVFAQIPFKRILQAFVSYEVFSTALEGEGLDFLQLDGDNEVLFSGVRLQLLPILFIQGEARRFYFTQRLSKVDVDQQIIEQDQNLRADWTFAINLYAGLEF